MMPPPMINTSGAGGADFGMAERRCSSAHLLRQLREPDDIEGGKTEEQRDQPERPTRGVWGLAVDEQPGVVRDFALPGVTDRSAHDAVANAGARNRDEPTDERRRRHEMRALRIRRILRDADL